MGIFQNSFYAFSSFLYFYLFFSTSWAASLYFFIPWIVVCAFKGSVYQLLSSAFFSGLFMDLVTSQYRFGFHTFSYLFIAAGLWTLRGRLSPYHLLSFTLTCLISMSALNVVQATTILLLKKNAFLSAGGPSSSFLSAVKGDIGYTLLYYICPHSLCALIEKKPWRRWGLLR